MTQRAKDHNQILREANDNYTLVFDYDASNNPVYIGKALLGSPKSDPVWQIRKLTYSGTNVTDIQWEDGDDLFDNIWDNRASGSYS